MAAMLFGSVACTQTQKNYAVDLAYINGNYNMMIQRYEIVKKLTKDKWQIFTEDEQSQLKLVDINVELIKTKVNTFRSENFYDISPAEIGYLYTLARESYSMARKIAIDHRDQLTTSEMMSLTIFDNQLVDLDKMVADLVNNPDNVDINMTLSAILGIGGAALKILLPLLI